MRKVKVGRLSLKEYAAEKPISVGPTGKLIGPRDVARTRALALTSLDALDPDAKIELALKRNRLEPNFTLGIIGVGLVTKAEVIQHIERETELGREVVKAELNYCNDLMQALAGGAAPRGPKIPKPGAARRVPSRPTDWRWIPPSWWKKWWRYFRNCALFCENTTDGITQSAASYRMSNVHPAFKKKGYCVMLLKGVHDVRTEFASRAKSKRVVYISGIGHGSPTTYTGHLGDPILQVGNYDPAEVKGKVIHLLSCKTAQKLGPDVIKKGASAYAGYYENFTFVWDQPGTPVNETELFWKCDSAFDLMMAHGATAIAAHNVTMAAYKHAIAQVPNTAAATWLTWDRNCFRSPGIDAIYGSKTAKISPWLKHPLAPFMEAEEELPALVAG